MLIPFEIAGFVSLRFLFGNKLQIIGVAMAKGDLRTLRDFESLQRQR
jgi:hypothetical protein